MTTLPTCRTSFRQYVGLGESYGTNNISVGVGNLEKQIVDFVFAKEPKKLAGWLPGIHVMAGLTGADNYKFAGWWGAALVLEPPDVVVGPESTNLLPHTIDTLDFSGVTFEYVRHRDARWLHDSRRRIPSRRKTSFSRRPTIRVSSVTTN